MESFCVFCPINFNKLLCSENLLVQIELKFTIGTRTTNLQAHKLQRVSVKILHYSNLQ